MDQEIIALLSAALECSYFIAPADPGLGFEEIQEFGRRLNYQPGEIGDALRQAAGASVFGSNRWHPNEQTKSRWGFFMHEEPELRNFKAFDFIFSELNTSIKSVGSNNAKIERSVAIERAAAEDIPRHDMAAAFLILLIAGKIKEKDGVVQFCHSDGVQSLPSTAFPSRQPRRVPARDRAYPLVKDIIDRRTDGRPPSAEPLDALSAALEKLGYGHFRLWWKQIVAEMRRSDPNLSPVTTVVLSAALVEGALTFVVKHARTRNLSVFKSSDFDKDPRAWKIDALVASAASGGSDAILDGPIKARAEILIRDRQRIHVGRMLSDFPNGAPDLRVEEAREAKGTAEQVVRRILDWLERHPPPND